MREKIFLGFGGMAIIVFFTVLYVFQSINTITDLTGENKNILLIQHRVLLMAIVAITSTVLLAVVVTRLIIAELRETDQQKSEFVALASHQLRTPPTIIKYDTEYLLSGDAGKLSPTQKKYLLEIQHANERMVDIIRALLNVSRMEMGTYAVRPTATQICDVIKTVLAEFTPIVANKKLKIKTTCAKMPVIMADPHLIGIVFQSLVANAVKYTPEKGKITIDVRANNRDIFVEVTDSGFGIPANVHDKIFSKLFRADNAQLHDPEGTGLGLYIAKSIIERANGKMWFESTEGKGSSFYFSLPRSGMQQKVGKTQLTA